MRATIRLVLALTAVLGACTAAKPNFPDGAQPGLDGAAADSGSDAGFDSGSDAAADAAADAGFDSGPDAAADAGRDAEVDSGVDSGVDAEVDAGPVCPPDTDDCDGDAGNGCEADLSTDEENCGACDAPCSGGRICIRGGCLNATIVDVAAGTVHTCALLSTGDLSCWGGDAVGQLGDCVVSSPDRHEPMPVRDVGGAPVTDAVAVEASANTTCAIRGPDRRVDCWGSNSPNRFGPASGAISLYGCPEPLLFSGSPMPVGALGLAGSHLCVLTGTSVQCAGNNASHQLGRVSPATTLLGPVVGLPAASPVDVAVGGVAAGFSLVASSDGEVHSFGVNTDSECAQEGGGSVAAPTPIADLTNIVQVAAGVRFACALDGSGRVRCWGSNGDGQTGTGTAGSVDVTTPTLVSGSSLPVFEEIAAGADFVLALVVGRHEIWGWGDNGGQFGLGPAMLDDLLAPTQLLVDPASTYDVAAGSGHALLVRHRAGMPDQLLCAGSNTRGECGQPAGATITIFAPVPSFP